MIAVKERPILFNGEMVKALLERRKTETRRVIKPQPILTESGTAWLWQPRKDAFTIGWTAAAPHCPTGTLEFPVDYCPYGQVGDRLWVRETFYTEYANPKVWYRSDGALLSIGLHWKPSIHMPRWASRITLEITGVKVERLQDFTERDAEAEGVEASTFDGGQTLEYGLNFIELWNAINLKRGYGWADNPWVWALSFKVVPQAIKALAGMAKLLKETA